MKKQRTHQIIEPHDTKVRTGQWITWTWPVRIWMNVFDVTEELDPETNEWIIIEKKFKRFFDRWVKEDEQNAPENAGLNFRVVDKAWLEREKEFLR
jgi:hypothetical protein